MKSKHDIIILSSIITIVSLGLMIIIQFRIYNYFGLTNRTNSTWISELRDFSLVILSGLFTGFLATLLITIREYKVEKRKTLHSILVQYNDLKVLLDGIIWYIPTIPSDILLDYYQLKYRNMSLDLQSYINQWKEEGISIPEEIQGTYNKHQEIICRFQDAVWKNEPITVKAIYRTEEAKQKYLKKRIPEIEYEIENSATNFLNSLAVFKNYNLYELESNLYNIKLLADKETQNYLSNILILFIPMSIDLIKNELNRQTKKDILHTSECVKIESLIRLNEELVILDPESKKYCCKLSYLVSKGFASINKVLYPWKKQKEIKLSDFEINHYHASYDSLDIVKNSLKSNLDI